MGRSPPPLAPPLKKGAWTPEEDQKLMDYIKKYGHGNWRALPKKCGLQRCGKSCRLRWTNYLRPDIKRGAFSAAEEQRIIQLHALVGNKWAFIASQLPKRTDNEIKNYWNTVLKKRVSASNGGAGAHYLHDGSSSSSCRMLQQQNGWNESSGGPDLRMMIGNVGDHNGGSGRAKSCHLTQWETARLEAEARLLSPPPPPPPPSSIASRLLAPYHDALNPKSARRDWQQYNNTAAAAAGAINLNSIPASGGAGVNSRSGGRASTHDHHPLLTLQDPPPNLHLRPSSTSSHGGGGGGNNNSSILNLGGGHHHNYHMNLQQLQGANLHGAAAEHGAAHHLVLAAPGGSGAGNSHLNMFTSKLLAGGGGSSGSVEAGAKNGGSSSSTSAIKLNGSNGRLSWNKHELSLPSLTTLGLHHSHSYPRDRPSSGRPSPSSAPSVHRSVDHPPPTTTHYHHHHHQNPIGDNLHSSSSVLGIDRAPPPPNPPMLDNFIDHCSSANQPSSDGDINYHCASGAGAHSMIQSIGIISTPSLHDLLLELDGSCSATLRSTDPQSLRHHPAVSVSAAAAVDHQHHHHDRSLQRQPLMKDYRSSCDKFSWLAAAAGGNDSSTCTTHDHDHCNSGVLMMGVDVDGSGNDFCVDDSSAVVDNCLDLYSNSKQGKACSNNNSRSSAMMKMMMMNEQHTKQQQQQNSAVDRRHHNTGRLILSDADHADVPATASAMNCNLLHHLQPPPIDGADDHLDLQRSAEIQFNNLLHIMDPTLASY